MLWAKQAAQMGFRWSVGDGRRIRFWEDHWFGNSSLAIQFWPLYVLINEQGKTIAEAWDGETLKFSFRRTVSPLLMEMWNDILSIAEDISFSNEPDSVVWKFTSNGVYSVQSLYAVVSFRGVKPVYPPAIWDLCIPPRVQVFLWLLSNNKLLTRDNLLKRREVGDKTCVFCTEPESISHLFFDCCVANSMWEWCSSTFGIQLTGGFENVAKWWLSRKKHAVLNICTSAILWCIWKLRNAFCFQGEKWSDVRKLMRKTMAALRRWQGLCKEENVWQLEEVVAQLEAKAREPLRIMRESRWLSTAPPTTSWEPPLETQNSSSSGTLQSDLQLLNRHLPTLVSGSVA